MTGWEGLLEADEDLLWQGRPDGAVTFELTNVITFVFGLCFAGFALFWMIMAAQAGGVFWMFGLIHFAVGLGMSVGGLFWSAFVRRHSWYTLSSKNAFIATDLPIRGRSLKSYPIGPETKLELIEGNLSTVLFATRKRRTKGGYHDVPFGFERIADGREVYQMMRNIQRAARQEARK